MGNVGGVKGTKQTYCTLREAPSLHLFLNPSDPLPFLRERAFSPPQQQGSGTQVQEKVEERRFSQGAAVFVFHLKLQGTK